MTEPSAYESPDSTAPPPPAPDPAIPARTPTTDTWAAPQPAGPPLSASPAYPNQPVYPGQPPHPGPQYPGQPPAAQYPAQPPAAQYPGQPGSGQPGQAYPGYPSAPGGYPPAGSPGYPGYPGYPPGYGSPGHGTPGYGTPGHGTPGHGTPGHGTPGYGTAGHGTAGYGTAGYEGSGPAKPRRTGLIVGIVIGVVVVLCAGFVGLFYELSRTVSNTEFVTVELSVTGSGNADITYDLDGTKVNASHSLPWTTTLRLPAGLLLTLRARPSQAGSGLVCTIKVKGTPVAQRSSSGPSQPVVCSATI